MFLEKILLELLDLCNKNILHYMHCLLKTKKMY